MVRAGIAQSYSAGLGLDNRVFESRLGLGIFLFTTASRPALEPTQRPLRVSFPGGKADHSPPSSTEIKNAWMYTSTPRIRPHGVVFS